MSFTPYSNVKTAHRIRLALHEIADGIRHLFQATVEDRRVKRQQRIDRDAFLNMITLDERMLKDIGIRQEDVHWASSLPLHLNAARELEKLRSQASR